MNVNGVQHKNLLLPIPASLAVDVAQGADGDVFTRVRHHHMAGFRGVLELFMVALATDQKPAFSGQAFDDFFAGHVFNYTHDYTQNKAALDALTPSRALTNPKQLSETGEEQS
jgi:hypothetical protein